MRSIVAFGALDSNSRPTLQTVRGRQTRSEVGVGACVSYSRLEHAVTVRQTRSDVLVGAAASYCTTACGKVIVMLESMGRHTRLKVPVPLFLNPGMTVQFAMQEP